MGPAPPLLEAVLGAILVTDHEAVGRGRRRGGTPERRNGLGGKNRDWSHRRGGLLKERSPPWCQRAAAAEPVQSRRRFKVAKIVRVNGLGGKTVQSAVLCGALLA